MAANALEEKINKIRLQNEEIKRRYEEVEADKKNAAKLNALVQMVPSSDWPERKEPPEFTRKETNKSNVKSKSVKEHSDRPQQYVIGAVEGKKIHKFAQGDGPPPDPKYNFLADSEREENNVSTKRDEDKQRAPNKFVRNGPRKRGGGRDGYQKDHRKITANSRDGHVPEYDAWRAERNRIDEARIDRQRTAEGNWRREWDNDKANIDKESLKKDPRFSSGDTSRRDYKEFEKRHQFEVEHSNRGRGGNHRGSHGPRTHGHYDNQYYDHQNDFSEFLVKGPLSPHDDRTVIATDKSIKVTVNHGNTPVKGPVMSVKVNAPSIAGTGRVGPRQKTRVTYSSHAEPEISTHQVDNFYRQKSFDEKTHFNNAQRTVASKSPFATRRKENNKSPFMQRKDVKRDEQSMRGHGENIAKSPSAQKKKFKDQQKSPQGQMHFFTSTPQGIVSSCGRGQKRVNGAKNNVIKILGHTDNNEGTILHSESANIDFNDVLAKSQQHDSAQFTETLVDETWRNQCESNKSEEIVAGCFTIEAENSNEDVKEANDSIVEVSRDSRNEETEELPVNEKSSMREEVKEIEPSEKSEEIEQFKTSEKTAENEDSEKKVVLKEIQVLEKNEELKISEKFENNEESGKSKVFEKCQVLETNETEKIDAEIIKTEERAADEIETEMEKIKTEEMEIEIKAEEREIETTKEKEVEKSETQKQEIKSEAHETEAKQIEAREREIEKIELKKKETEETESENKKTEKNELSDKEIEKSESEDKEIEKIEPKEIKIDEIEPEMEKIEREEEKTEEKIEPNSKEMEKIEPDFKEIEKIEPDSKEIEKIEPNSKEIEKIEPKKTTESQEDETPKNEKIEIIDKQELAIDNIDEKLPEQLSSNIEESTSNTFSKIEKVEICDSESNETKIGDNEEITSKSEIIESVEDIAENSRESETKSVESSETVSSKIFNEASCVPSE